VAEIKVKPGKGWPGLPSLPAQTSGFVETVATGNKVNKQLGNLSWEKLIEVLGERLPPSPFGLWRDEKG
jgi:hypothetical protein